MHLTLNREVEIIAHTDAIELTSLQAEQLVPRSKLWTPPRPKTRGQPSSSSRSDPLRRLEQLDCQFLLFEIYYPAPGCSDPDSFQEPRRPTRVAVFLGRPFPRSAAAYLWHNKRYL